jgi:hypothetical protein
VYVYKSWKFLITLSSTVLSHCSKWSFGKNHATLDSLHALESEVPRPLPYGLGTQAWSSSFPLLSGVSLSYSHTPVDGTSQTVLDGLESF